ncbi:hypothetical protein JHK82_056833 [Glycine max]|nr:hypothetical protein JHK82_056833 [Glycine max]
MRGRVEEGLPMIRGLKEGILMMVVIHLQGNGMNRNSHWTQCYVNTLKFSV